MLALFSERELTSVMAPFSERELPSVGTVFRKRAAECWHCFQEQS